MLPTKFRTLVWRHYRVHGRHDLPWRKTYDPYKVLVSEVMLQQTQVERVIPFYKKFIKKFPTARHLASASLASVLQMWQGLGYNRRAKQLHAAAKEFETIPILSYRTDLVSNTNDVVLELRKLSGVGPYTACAVAAFAFNKNVIFIETNIRTAIIHHFFRKKRRVSDDEIEKILMQMLPKGRAREWYSALMDYGAYLKRSGISHNAQSRHYAKQSKFVGSLREARGAILRELAKGPCIEARLADLLGKNRVLQMRRALGNLRTESLIQKRGKVFTLPR